MFDQPLFRSSFLPHRGLDYFGFNRIKINHFSLEIFPCHQKTRCSQLSYKVNAATLKFITTTIWEPSCRPKVCRRYHHCHHASGKVRTKPRYPSTRLFVPSQTRHSRLRTVIFCQGVVLVRSEMCSSYNSNCGIPKMKQALRRNKT